MRDSHRGHAIDRSVLDSGIRHSGTGGSRSLFGECAGYEEFTGAEDRRAGKSVADEAAYLRLTAQFISAVTGSPHPADVLAATARSGAGGWGACATDAERKLQMTRLHVRMQNQLESLLEEAHIKLSGFVTDLLGVSARRMLQALADGETDPAALAALADKRLRATPAQLCDALGACTELNLVYRRLIKMALEELQFLEQQMGQLDQEIANLLRPHEDAVKRLAEVPGLGVDSAQQIIAEVGPTVASFSSDKQLCSWVAVCPGDNETGGVNYSHRSPKGNRQMRRILNQSANAAARTKGSIFEIVYRRQVMRMGHNQAIGVIAHRLCRLIWILLHRKVRYEERGPAVTERSKRVRTLRMIRTLRNLGYRVEPLGNPA